MPVIFLLAVASFLYSQYLSDLGLVEANFYFIFSRAWELLLGSVIAFFPVEKIRFKGWKREFWSMLGFAMICYSIFSFDDRTPYPIYMLLPVIGSCFVILFANPSTWVGRILSTKAFIFIGLISYSLYLWHQPLFALIRVRTLGEPPTTVFIIAILCSVILATFSWKFIEAPFRNKQKFSRAAIFKFSSAFISIFFLMGLSGFYINNLGPNLEPKAAPIAQENNDNIVEDLPLAASSVDDTIRERENNVDEVIANNVDILTETEQVPDNNAFVQEQETRIDTRRIAQPASTDSYEREYSQNDYFGDCHSTARGYLSPSRACTYFDGNDINWAILGDSHSNSLGYALAAELQERNQGLLHLTFRGCPPAISFESIEDGCTTWTREAVSKLVNNDEIENVVVTYYHSLYLHGDHLYIYPEVPDSSVWGAMVGDFDGVAEESLRNIYWRSFTTIITRLLDAGKTVYITFPIPEVPDNIYKDYLFDIRIGAPYEYYLARNNYILQMLRTLPYGDKLKAVNSPAIFCNGSSCPAVKNGRLLYMDDNHLNVYGASLVVDEILSK